MAAAASRKRERETMVVVDDEEEEADSGLVQMLQEQADDENAGTLGDLLRQFAGPDDDVIQVAVDGQVRSAVAAAATTPANGHASSSSSSSSTAAEDKEEIVVMSTRTGAARTDTATVDARIMAMASKLVHSARPHAAKVDPTTAIRPEEGIGNLPTDTHAAVRDLVEKVTASLYHRSGAVPSRAQVFADPVRLAGLKDELPELSASHVAALLISAGQRPARIAEDGAIKMDRTQIRIGPPCKLGAQCRGMDTDSGVPGIRRPTPFMAYLSPSELVRFEQSNVLPRDVVSDGRPCLACRMSAISMYQVFLSSFVYEAPNGLLAQTFSVNASTPHGEFDKRYCHLPSETGWNGLCKPVLMWLPSLLEAYPVEEFPDVYVVSIARLLQPGVNPTNFHTGGAPSVRT